MLACVPSGPALWLLTAFGAFALVGVAIIVLSPLWSLVAVIAEYRRARQGFTRAWTRRISLASMDCAVGPYRNARRTVLVPANPPLAIAAIATMALFTAYLSPAFVPGALALSIDPGVGLLAAPAVVALALRTASFGRALLRRNGAIADVHGPGIVIALCFVALASVVTGALIHGTGCRITG